MMETNDSRRLERLLAAARDPALQVDAVSRWSAGLHVQHCCLAARAICAELEREKPEPRRSWRSVVGWLVLWRGKLPRGRARAPARTQPERPLDFEELSDLVGDTARRIARARALPPRAWFAHFMLGPLRRDPALRFIAVHDEHHLRIVAEITAAAALRRAGVRETEPAAAGDSPARTSSSGP